MFRYTWHYHSIVYVLRRVLELFKAFRAAIKKEASSMIKLQKN